MNKKIISLALAGIIAASGVVAVSAEDSAERAKGIKFTADSGYSANVYTGYVGGVTFDTTTATLLAALENKNGISVMRDKALGDSDEVQHGDKLVLKNDAGEVKTELEIIFMGNADKNNKFNLGDASAMLKKVAKWDVDIDEVAADVNGDGQVNLSDVSSVLKAIAKWDVDFVKVPVLPGKGDARIASVKATFATGNQANINLRKGQDYAVKFTVEAGKIAKTAKAQFPSWGDSKGSIRLSLYKWDTDYETTVAAEPLATQLYENFADNTELVFSFLDSANKGVGEGEYLWRIHEGYEDTVELGLPGGVGMWTQKTPAADSGMVVYYEGEALAPGTDSYGPVAYISLGN